jgi:hypothetical protein
MLIQALANCSIHEGLVQIRTFGNRDPLRAVRCRGWQIGGDADTGGIERPRFVVRGVDTGNPEEFLQTLIVR